MADKLVIKIDGDDDNLRKTLSGIGGVAKKGLGVAIKGLAATSAAVASLSAVAIKGYAEYEQLAGGVDTLFKDSASTLKKYADEAYKTAGMSANKYMSGVTSFSAAMINSVGGDTAKAAELSNKAMIAISDNANKMGTDIESIVQTYQSLARGNVGMLDNLKLGYGGTKAELERLIRDAEEYKRSMGEVVNFDASNFADVTLAIQAIQEKLGIAGATAEEAATTIEGSANAMKASWQNLLVGFADENADLDKLLDNFTDSVLAFGKNIIPRIKTTLNGIGKFVTKSASKLMPQIVDAIVATIPDLVSAAAKLAKSLGNALISNLDNIIASVASIIKELVDGITDVVPALKPLGSIVKFAADNFKGLAAAVIAGTVAFKTLTVAQTAGAAVNTLLGTAMASLTGKIELQTVATVALTAAKKMLSGHIGLVIAGVTAAVAGLIAWISSTQNATKQTAEFKQAVKENTDAIQERSKAIEEGQKGFADSVLSTKASMQHTQKLADELFSLVDANGQVNEAEKGRAEFILGELNEALGTEYRLTDLQAGKYAELKESIYALIEAKKAEAYMNAYQSEYETALKNQKTDIENLTQTKALHNDVLLQEQEYLDGIAQAKAELAELDANAINGEVDLLASVDAQNRIQEYTTLLEQLRANNQEAFDAIAEAEANVQKDADIINTYNESWDALADKDYSTVISNFDNLATQLSDSELATQKFAEGTTEHLGQLGGKYQSAVVSLIEALKTYEDAPSESAANMVAGALAELNGAEAAYINAGGTMKDGVITGWDGVNFGVEQDISLLLAELYNSVPLIEAASNEMSVAGSVAISDAAPDWKTAAGSAGEEGAAGFSATAPSWGTAASNATSAIVNTLEAAKAVVYNKSFELGAIGVTGYNAGQNAHSPAKEYEKASGYSIAGLIKGFNKNAPKFKKLTETFAKDTAENLLEIVSELDNELAYSDMERLLAKAKTREEMEKIIDESNLNILENKREYLIQSQLLKDSELESDKERLKILEENADAEKEIYASLNDYIEERKEDYIDSLEDIKDAQKDFADDLKTDLYESFKTDSIVINGRTIKFDDEVEDIRLTNWDKENKRLNRYNEILSQNTDRLKSMFGSDTEGFNEILEEIREDDELLAAINEASDAELLKWVQGYQENKQLRNEIAGDSFTDNELAELKKSFENEFGTLPDTFFALGEEGAQNFAEKFIEGIKSCVAEAQNIVTQTMQSMFPTAALAGVGTVSNETNKVYSPTYNFYGPAEGSLMSKIMDAQNFDMYNKASGGW